MKKTLLFLCALFVTTMGMRAQSWTAPTLEVSYDEIPAEAYVYHVGQGGFLTAVTWYWSTHAGITTDASSAWLYEIEELEEGVYTLYSASAANLGYLFAADTTHPYTDLNAQTTSYSYFNITKDATSGCYRIGFAESNGVASSEWETYSTYQLGWDPSSYNINSSSTDLGYNTALFMLDSSNTDAGYEFDFGFVAPDIMTLYVVRTALYDKLVEAYEEGYGEDELADYSALLTSTDSASIADATAAVSDLILNYAYNHATEDNPYDITSVISNPTMEGTRSAEPDGDWIDTYGNMLIQNNASYLLWDDEAGELSSEYGLNNFSQNWTSSTTDPIDASDIHQVISDLPQGKYIMTADCIATSASSALTVSGASLYAISSSITYSVDIDKNPYGEDGAGYPHRYTVDITHFGGDLTIGYGFVPGYVKWFAVDNFTLAYAGPVDNAGLLALQAVYPSLKEYYDEWDNLYFYSEDTYNAIGEEIEKADDIINDGDSDECEAEAAVLNTLLASLKEEINAYTSLQSLIEQVETDMAKYENIADLSEGLSDMYDTYTYALEDKTASTEQITEWVDSYDAYILAGVKAAMSEATTDNPVEITVLCTNMDYSTNSSTEGWTVTTGTAGNSGSYAVSYYVAEVWSNTFACLQTLDDMPAGKYTLKAKAFYRTSDYATSYTDYIAGTGEVLTYLVVNTSKSAVVNMAAGAITADDTPYTGYVEVEEGSGIYVPNSMQAASIAFGLDDTYACEVSGYQIEDGTLTFGIRNDDLTETDAWSIWSNFQLYYCGTDVNALYETLLDYVNEASELQDQVSVIAAADEKINEALATADEVTASSDEADILAAIEELQEAIAYGEEGIELISELQETLEVYETKVSEVESTDNAFPELLETIESAISEEEFVSNEQMTEWINSLAGAWTAYVQYDCLTTASKDEPADITAVITNPSFDYGTNDTSGATGWEFTYTGNHIGWSNTTQQTNSDNAYEFWNVTVFKMSQTIVGLAEGYYHLTCNAIYRAGNNSADLAAAYLETPEDYDDLTFYANTVTAPVTNAYSIKVTEDPGITAETTITVNDETWYVPNTMQAAYGFFEAGYYLNELDVYVAEGADLVIGLNLTGNLYTYNWGVFDNFTISYLGNGDENMPDAINAIEADTDASANSAKAIYDLSGRRVSKAQKGVYIIDGKKVLVK